MTKRPTTREAIVEAAFDLLSANPGASLGDIARHAGVGRATLHRQFASRDELISALAHQALDELNTAADQAAEGAETYLEAFERGLKAIIPLANRQLLLDHENPERDPSVAAAYRASRDQLIADIKAAQDAGEIRADQPPIWIATLFDGVTYAAWSLIREEELTQTQASQLAWESLLKGIADDH